MADVLSTTRERLVETGLFKERGRDLVCERMVDMPSLLSMVEVTTVLKFNTFGDLIDVVSQTRHVPLSAGERKGRRAAYR